MFGNKLASLLLIAIDPCWEEIAIITSDCELQRNPEH